MRKNEIPIVRIQPKLINQIPAIAEANIPTIIARRIDNITDYNKKITLLDNQNLEFISEPLVENDQLIVTNNCAFSNTFHLNDRD